MSLESFYSIFVGYNLQLSLHVAAHMYTVGVQSVFYAHLTPQILGGSALVGQHGLRACHFVSRVIASFETSFPCDL